MATNFYLLLKGKFELFFSLGLKLNIANNISDGLEIRGLNNTALNYYLVGWSGTVVSDNGSFITQLEMVYSPIKNYFISLNLTTNIGVINFFETQFIYNLLKKEGGITFIEDVTFLNA